MTLHDEDWPELSRMWTEADADAPAIDAGIVAAVRRRDLLGRLNFAMEILISLAGLGFLAWAMAAHVLTWLPACATFAFIVFAMAMSLWSRRQSPVLLTGTQAEALSTAVAQARSGRRWALAGLAICGAGAAYMAAMALSLPRSGADTLVALLASGVFLLVWVFICIGHARAAGRRIKAYEDALAALEDDISQD